MEGQFQRRRLIKPLFNREEFLSAEQQKSEAIKASSINFEKEDMEKARKKFENAK